MRRKWPKNSSDDRRSEPLRRKWLPIGFTDGVLAEMIALTFGIHHLLIRVKLLPFHRECDARLDTVG